MRTLIQVIKDSAFSGQHLVRQDLVVFLIILNCTLDFDTRISDASLAYSVCVPVCVNSVGCGSD